MGCCQSTEQVEEKQRNQEIDAQIKRDRVNLRKEIKMLLLGKHHKEDMTFLFVINKEPFKHRCGRVWKINDIKANEIDS